MNTVQLVKGKITFEEETPAFTGATMYVRLENITIVDIASEVIADYVERDVAFDPKTNALIHPAHNLIFFSRAFLFLAVFEEGVNGEINRTIC